jgi:hypothetical protein
MRKLLSIHISQLISYMSPNRILSNELRRAIIGNFEIGKYHGICFAAKRYNSSNNINLEISRGM